MKYVKTNWDIPYYNMAFEKYVMNNTSMNDDYFFFYIHKPSIIIGKHQNTIEEINEKYVKDNNIIVARRNTGGGAVYHDKGNLNFSFIMNRKDESIDFSKYTLPIINALKKLGVNASLSGRNDILIDGKKVSGNAQGMNKHKTLHHGTLMFDVNVEALVNSLNVSQKKIESKAIKSVRSRVTNISDLIDSNIDIFKFKQLILNEVFNDSEIEEYSLTNEDMQNVQKLVDETYSTWEFNYGYSPKYKIEKEAKIEGCGLIKTSIDVRNGLIDDIKITGDYFSIKETEELENILKQTKYEKSSLMDKLNNINIEDYISNINNEKFLTLIFD